MSTPEKGKIWRAKMKSEGRCTTCAKIKQRPEHDKCDKCMADMRDYSNKQNRIVKLETITAYGGRCSGVRSTGACVENDVDILEIDHINGGGNKHRAESGMRGVNFYKFLRRTGWPSGYRVLCKNCNWLAYLGRLLK